MTIKLIVRDYWAKDFSHQPYQTVLHDHNDKSVSKSETLTKLLESIGAHDGDEVEIRVTTTGRRPFGNTRWVWQGPHEYGPESAEAKEE